MEYIVKPGDSLSLIAAAKGTSVATLMRLNPEIKDANHIHTGSVLIIPDTAAARGNCSLGSIAQDSECASDDFVLAFYWNDEARPQEDIYTEIYGEEMHFALRSIFERNNAHLGATVLPGEIVIVSNMPKSTADRERLNSLREQARLASEGIQQLTVEEATTLKRHIEILESPSVIEGVVATQGTALGVVSATAGRRLSDLKSVLKEINSTYLDELSRSGGTSRFSQVFYERRSGLFKRLDNAAERLTMSRLSIRQYHGIKNTLGLSTKSILHNASSILEQGEVPQLGRRINTVSNWMKGASRLGWAGIAIDVGLRTNKVVDACTIGSESECKVASFKQVGGALGSAGGGAVVGAVAAKGAVMVVGGLALIFGVTLGAPVIAVVALVGAGAGAYVGGFIGGAAGESFGEVIYERIGR